MTVLHHRILGLGALALASLLAACDSSGTGEGGSGSEDSGAESPYEGQAFRLLVPSTSWSEPSRDVGSEIGAYVPMFLIGFGETSDGSIEVTIASADQNSGDQDECNSTTVIELDSPETPNEIGPLELHARLTGAEREEGDPVQVDTVIHDLTLTDVLPIDGEVSEDGILEATIDFREVYPLLTELPNDLEPTPERACDALAQVDAACEPCDYPEGDGEEFCLTLKALLLGAEPDDDLTVEVVGEDDIGSDCELPDP